MSSETYLALPPGLYNWDYDRALKLIQEFKKRDILWDPRNPLFFNLKMKETAWEQIEAIMNVSKHECKRKMESLKGSFRREKSRGQKVKAKSGSDTFRSKWFAFEAMRFMDDRDDPRTPKKSETVNHPEAVVEVELLENSSEEPEVNTIDLEWDPLAKTEPGYERDYLIDESSDDPLLAEEEEIHIPPEQQQCINESEDVLTLSERNGLLQIEASSSPPAKSSRTCTCKDEFSTYGEHVAHKLRKLDDRTRMLVQHRINNLLYKAERKLFGYVYEPT